jgi:hypothetical protein
MSTRKMLPMKITIREKYDPAMQMTDQAEADEYFRMCVEHTAEWLIQDGKANTMSEAMPKAEVIERTNLGYYAGYYSTETRERVERLFRCEHPVFGAIAANGQPSTADALIAGVKAGIHQRETR